MKITSLQENLKRGLTLVSHIAGKNVNLPILNNIMIEAKAGNIRLISTDLEIGVIAAIRGKVEKEGVYTVDSRVISEYISLLPNQKVELVKKDNKLNISTDNYKTSIKGQEAEDYPLIPQVERDKHYKIDAEELKQALSQVIFAVSSAETRLELSGVLFSCSQEELTLVATDSYRLAERRLPLKGNGEARQIIVPAKTIQELVRILSTIKSEEVSEKKLQVEMCLSENQVMFVIDSIELVSRLIEGQYPDYQQIIPQASQTTVKLAKNELSRAVKAAAIFSKTGINDINLDFPSAGNKATITSESSQVGENTADISAEVKGKDNGIVVNYRYLLDGINNIDTEKVVLEVIDAGTPCILRPEKKDNYLYIIMPIKQ